MTERAADLFSLDAAWDRARALETERDKALAYAAAAKTRLDALNTRHAKLIVAVGQVIDKHRGNLAAGEIRDELRALIWKLGGGGNDERPPA